MKKSISALSLCIIFVLIFSTVNTHQVYCEELSTVSLKDSNITVVTKGNTASIVIQRANTTESVTVYYRTINGSGIANTHYTPKTGTVTFNSGETSKSITVNTLNFNTWEKENRFFYVEIYKIEGNGTIDKSKNISKITINHKDNISQSLVGKNHDSIRDHYWDAAPYFSAQFDTGVVHLNNGEPKSYVGYLDILSNTTYQYFIQNNQLNYYGQIVSKVANEGNDDEIKVILYKNGTAYKSDGYHDAHDFRCESTFFKESDMKSINSIKYRYEADAQGWGDDDANVYYRFIHWLYDDNKPSLESFHVVGNTSEPYSDGDDLYISAKFSEIVTVSSGIPQIPIKFSDNSITYANYIGGAGTDTLVFKSSIPNSRTSNGLYIYNPTSNDSFVGESYVKDLAGNTMNAYSNTSCVSTNIKIQNTIPKINSITPDKINVSLNEADDVTLTINFSEEVIITGTPILNLNNGKTASLTSGTGGSVLSADFTYNIGTLSSENTQQLYITSLSGGSILDCSGNPLDRSIPTTNINNCNIRIDNIAPIVLLSINGNDTYEKSQSTIMYITDANGSGIGLVSYVWSESSATPNDSLFTGVGGNNIPAKIIDETGKKYLHIRAYDKAGNVSYFKSLAFKLDNTSPTIDIGDDGKSISKAHTVNVDLTDEHSGVNGMFKYIWSTSTSIPSDDEFDSSSSGTEGEDITKDTGNGNYYLHIRAYDKAGNNDHEEPGNKSYEKEGPYIFDNIAPDIVTITNKDGNGNIISSSSDQKIYNIQISAQDTNNSYSDGSIESIKYRWSDKNEQISITSTGWIIYSNSFSYNNEETSGGKYLHVITQDIAGNTKYNTFLYTFDYTVPNIKVTSDDLSGVNGDLTSKVEVSDIHNNISVFKYIWRDNITQNFTDGDWINGSITGNTGLGNPTKNNISGNWFLHVYCKDSVGNYAYKVTGPYTLDVDGPTGEIEIEENTINEGSITLNISATDNIPNNNLKYSLSQNQGTSWSEWMMLISPLTINNYTINNVEEGITTVLVKFKDESGNISEIYSDNVRVDKTPPTADVLYNPIELEGWTNLDVMSSLTNLKDNLPGAVKTPSGLQYNFISNGTHVFEIEDLLGNSATVSAIVSWIDKISPTIGQVSGNQTVKKEHSAVLSAADNVTNNENIKLYYQWTNDNIKPDVDNLNWIEGVNGQTVTKKEVDGDWYLHIKAIDEAGNKPVSTSGKFVFDNTPPTGDKPISITPKFSNKNIVKLDLQVEDAYSSTSDIKYSLSNDNENWSEWYNYANIIYSYEAGKEEGINTVYIKFKDKLGNESIVYSDHFTIDNTPPTGSLQYSLTAEDGYTNEDVIVSVVDIGDDYSDKEDIYLNDTNYTFTKNEEYVFILKDEVGNETTLSAIVGWIDKNSPTIGQVSGNQTVKKEHSAVLSATDNVTNNEVIKLYYQWTKSNVQPDVDDSNWIEEANGQTVTKKDVDGDWYLHIKAIDEAGNKPISTSGKFVFDNTPPTGDNPISIAPEYKFIKNNIIQLNLGVQDTYSNISEIEYSLSNDNINWSDWNIYQDIIYDHEASNNDGINCVYIKYRDKLGNESIVYSDDFTIDNIPPVAELEYDLDDTNGYINSDVTVNVVNIDDNYSEINNIWLNDDSYTFTTNGEYIFRLRDEVGNETTLSAIVSWIDKEKPSIMITPNSDQTAKKEHKALISAADNTTTNSSIAVAYQWTNNNDTPENNDPNWISIINKSEVSIDGLNGDRYLHVRAIDEPGNQKTQTSGKFVLDNSGPSGSIDVLEEIIKSNKVTLNLSAEDEVSNVGQLKYSLSLDGENWAEWNTFSEMINNYEIPLVEGNQNIYVKYKDNLNNESDIYNDLVILDLTPPSAKVNYSSKEENGYVNTDVVVSLSNILDNYSTIENIMINETSHTFETNGDYVFTLEDEVGNIRSIDIQINYIDKEDPIIQPISGNQNPKKTHEAYIDVSDNVTSNDAIDVSYKWTKDDNISSTEENWIEVENGTTISNSGINGEWYLYIKAIDEVENYSTLTSGMFLFDNKTPNGTITYSTENRTAQSVIATLSTNETVNITNTKNGINKYTFNDNGEFVFEFEDLAGNKNTAKASVDWIDKSIPSANVDISTTDWTNEDVIVEVSVPISSRIEILDFDFGEISEYNLVEELSRELTINDNEDEPVSDVTCTAIYSKSYSIGENGKIVFNIGDIDTLLEQEIEITVDNIDKEDPTYNISLSETNLTNNDIVINISTEDNTNLPVKIIKPKNVLELNDQYIINDNGTYNFQIEDISGNTVNIPVDITNIDKKAPKLSIEYSKTKLTNQNVIATLISDEDIIIQNNNKDSMYEFTENGTFTFEVRDLAGNTNSITAEVDYIDKILPDADIVCVPTTITNSDVTVTINPNEKVNIESMDKLALLDDSNNEFVIKENGTYKFKLLDKAGNVNIKTIIITNIDKENPEITYTLSTAEMTNENVEIFLHGNETFEVITVPEKIIISEENNDIRYYAKESGEYIFTVKDEANNQINVKVNITNIDKVATTLTISYSETKMTNKDVIATVIADEEVIFNNNGGDKYIFTKNGEYEFSVTDMAGNTSEKTAVVENIDKEKPSATLSINPGYTVNTDVVITVEPDEIATIKSKENLELVENKDNQFIVKKNGEYSFVLTDEAGNQFTKVIDIKNIDKDSPEITYTLSTEEETNKEVEIYLYGNESFEVSNIPKGIRTIIVDDEIKYYADGNGTYIFKVADEAGNEGEKVVIISNIDKIAPELSLTYSCTEWTNEDVKATVTANEEIIVKNNGGNETYNFKENDEFEFVVMDEAGNESKITAIVTKIDKVNPNAILSFKPDYKVNTDVIITIEPSEIVTIVSSNDLQNVLDKDKQYIVTKNGTYDFELTDRAGNVSMKKIKIDNIDKESPIMKYTLSKEDKTNLPVEIYFYANEPFNVKDIPKRIRTIIEEDVTKYYADESGLYKFTTEDLYGNEGELEVNITNIDKVPPELSVTYSAINWTNNDVTATVLANEDIIVLNNDNKTEYVFSQNGEFDFYVQDVAGNKNSITASVSNIDKKSPSATFVYSNTEITKEDIAVTITGNETLSAIVSEEELESITDSAIDVSISKKFGIKTNGEYHFNITDLAGNIKNYEIYVTNIDKNPPIMTYTLVYDTPAGIKEVNQDGEIIKGPVINSGDDAKEYQNSLITKNDVLLEFNANETYEITSVPEKVSLNDDGEYIIEDNGEYIFIAKDIAGNTTSVTVVVDTIEKSTPQVEIKYSETNTTRNNVTATVVSTNGEYIRVVNNYNLFNKVFSQNGEYTFIIQDYAGNEVNITATVNNIDTTPPELSLEFSTTEYTNQSVIVSLIADEEINVINNDGSKYYTFEDNGEMRFVAEDLIGNSSEITATICNIDKTAPIITFSGNDKLAVLEGEEIDLLSGVSTLSYEDQKLPINIVGNVDTSFPGKYFITYEITDNAGNTSTKTREVNVISKDSLILTFNGINPDEVNYISGKDFDLNTYNTKGEYTILYYKGKLTKGQIKIKGEELLNNELNVLESGWHTFLIYDQERNTKFYNLYIIK